MLEGYSGIPSDETLQHVHEIRDKAWSIRTYPCTSLGIWLTPMISHQEGYFTVLSRLKAGTALLDVGCFIGQELRRLVYDGAPSESLCGVDIASHWDVGFEMFRDRSKFHAKFIECDILTPNADLAALEGTFGVIYISQVLHQWGWDAQIKGGAKVLETAKSKATYFWHDEETFKELWKQVGEETGTKWVAEATLKSSEEGGLDPKDTADLGPETRFLGFVVRRLDEVEYWA
ncbi:hypothetical protein BKA61DRAFT_634327 [Leptodontidium sp. MPI-SDFR-AT-0119]|nr:hypothetical protein BKA61DRAFT_634327 [Leptodontidium sp. MPI-SDFR-AT-0119]